jgi:hypothetical protein
MAEEVWEIVMQGKSLTRDDAGVLILLAAILFGGWFRVMPAFLAGFPVNDGGMFLVMIQDLQSSRYALPDFTSYNNLNIPFVYPPLGFYLGAAITDLLRLSSPLPVIQWLPGILNALTIPAFYLLAKVTSKDKFQSALAALLFAFTPHLTSWLSMGGGLTRSPGLLFMLLALAYIHRMFEHGRRMDVLGSVLFSSLTVLSHTEAPLYALAIAVYFWAAKSRSLKGVLDSAWVAVGVLALASPWWIAVISRHSLEPMLSAAQTGLSDNWSLFRLIKVNAMTGETYLDLIGAAGVIGMAILAARGKFFIPGMFLVVGLVNPRSAHIVGNIPLALAGGFLLAEIILPSLSRRDEPARRIPALLVFTLIAIPWLFSNPLYYAASMAGNHVSVDERLAMQWIRENTPEESAFLIVTGETNGFCDSTGEWFPALTGRRSLATLQGNEWLKGNAFRDFIGDTQALQACARQGLDCILEEAGRFTTDFDYLYVSLSPPTLDCAPVNASGLTRGLLLELQQSAQFEPVFSSQGAAIFKRK